MFSSITAILLSYLVGAIPFGLIVSKAFSGVDVRSVGSGNIGATNVLRAAGKKAALLTLILDMLKGFVPALAAGMLFADDLVPALSAGAAILGHNFPVYLGFRGGKGVATSFGAVLAISPLIGIICLLSWLAAAYVWRYSSLAALIAFALYPALMFLSSRSSSRPLGLLSLFVFGMIYVRHRENIRRLLSGIEPKIGHKS